MSYTLFIIYMTQAAISAKHIPTSGIGHLMIVTRFYDSLTFDLDRRI